MRNSRRRRRTLAGLSIALIAAGIVAFGPAAAQSEPRKTKADILKDGKVTAEEQRAAVGNVVSCLTDAGIAAKAIPTSDEDYWTYRFSTPSSDAAAAHAMQESQRCAALHVQEVLDLYDSAEESTLTEAKTQAAVVEMSECLRDKGLRTPRLPETVDGPAYQRLLDAARAADPAATSRCAVKAGLARSVTY